MPELKGVLVSPTEIAKAYVMSRELVRRLIKTIEPAYSRGDGQGRVVLYRTVDVVPVIEAHIEELKKRAAPPPPPEPQPESTKLDLIAAQIRAVFGNTEILRQRLEDVKSDVDGIDLVALTHRLMHMEAAGKQHKEVTDTHSKNLGEVDARVYQLSRQLNGLGAQVDGMHTEMRRLNVENLVGRLDTIEAVIDNLGAELKAGLNRIMDDMNRLMVPLPTPSLLASDMPPIQADRVVPVTVTTGPAFKEPKPKPKTRTVVILGLTDGQRVSVKAEIRDAWDMHFFEGNQQNNGDFRKAMEKAEFMLVLSSFRGKGPEQLAKEAGKPCIRVDGGTRGLIDHLIEKL